MQYLSAVCLSMCLEARHALWPYCGSVCFCTKFNVMSAICAIVTSCAEPFAGIACKRRARAPLTLLLPGWARARSNDAGVAPCDVLSPAFHRPRASGCFWGTHAFVRAHVSKAAHPAVAQSRPWRPDARAPSAEAHALPSSRRRPGLPPRLIGMTWGARCRTQMHQRQPGGPPLPRCTTVQGSWRRRRRGRSACLWRRRQRRRNC